MSNKPFAVSRDGNHSLVETTWKGKRIARASTKADERAEHIRELRRKTSQLASKANKRIQRLERNNLTTTPAYERYIAEGAQKFGVKGKSYNEVQRELARLRRFLESETSTVRGAHSVLKDMAANTGIKYKNFEELKTRSSQFFELASKVEQYLRNVEDAASAIGYKQIWDAINKYTQEQGANLEDIDQSLDTMTQNITKALMKYDTPVMEHGSAWYPLKDE